MKQSILFAIIILIGLSVMAMYTFFGLLTLIGLIALVESWKPLRWLFERTANVIDVIIFIMSIAATIHLGVTITASLIVAGLGFTLVYKPYLRNRYMANKQVNNNHNYL